MVIISDTAIEMATKNESDANNKKLRLEKAKMLKKKALRLQRAKKMEEQTVKKLNQNSTDCWVDHEVK